MKNKFKNISTVTVVPTEEDDVLAIVSGYRKAPGGIVSVERNGLRRRYRVNVLRYRWIREVMGHCAINGSDSNSSFHWRLSRTRSIKDAHRWLKSRSDWSC